MLAHLIYHSISSVDNTEQDIQDILKESRTNNKTLSITGCLIHRNDEFVQILEGEASAVLDLYSKIEKDPRHHHVALVTFENINKRIFTDWSMAYRDIPVDNAHGLNKYLNIINQEVEPELFSDLNKYSSYKMFCAVADQVLVAQ